MPCTIQTTPIKDLLVIEPKVFPDSRGWFYESYKASDYQKAGIVEIFVQDNHSLSCRGTLRGLHFQTAPHAQGKLVRVTRGCIWDVAIDLRHNSATFGQWHGLELSAENRLVFWIPAGFAHGFISLEDDTELQYKCTAEYCAAADAGLHWNSPLLNIPWPDLGLPPLLSPKDEQLPPFDPSSVYFKDFA